jgi:hypothetical protein
MLLVNAAAASEAVMETAHSRLRWFWRALLRDPLTHFVLLGGLVFAVDVLLARGPARFDQLVLAEQEDPRVIVIGPRLDRELRLRFHEAERREPTSAELDGLRARWLDEEMLYREGLALRLDQGDSALRERLIRKVSSLLDANMSPAEPAESELRAWFERQRAQYDAPARFDFTEAPLGSDASEASAGQVAATLNAGVSAALASELRLFAGRPRNTVAAAFGEEFANALQSAPLGKWQVVPSIAGPRVVRLEYRTAPAPSRFESVRSEVRRDVSAARAQEQRSAALRELGKKYTVKVANEES